MIKTLINSKELVISFITGGIIMAIELLAAKITEPLFGRSITIWSAIILFTMLGLTFGYIIGAYLSKLKGVSFFLILSMFFVSIILYSTPLIVNYLYQATYELNLKTAIALVMFFLIFPQFLILGLFSPLIIQILNKEKMLTGYTSGKVYTVSTLGGIFFLLFIGLYFLPNFGISFTFISLSVVMFVITIIYSLLNLFNKSKLE